MKHDSRNTYKFMEDYFADKLSTEQEQELQSALEKTPDAKEVLKDEHAFRSFMFEAKLHTSRRELSEFMAQQKPPINYTKYIVSLIVGIFIIAGGYFVIQSQNEPVVADIAPEANQTASVISVSETQVTAPLEKPTITKAHTKAPTKQTDSEDNGHENELSAAVIFPAFDSILHTDTDTINSKMTANTGKKQEYSDEFLAISTISKLREDLQDNPCIVPVPNKNIEIIHADLDSEYGSISISSDNPEISFALSSDSVYEQNGYFEATPGTYNIFVKDAEGCVNDLGHVTVERDICKTEYPLSFSPDKGESWTIPTDTEKDFSVKIINKQFQELYTYQSQSGGQPQWNGTDQTGVAAPLGYYKVLIEYNSGENCIFGVSIIK